MHELCYATSKNPTRDFVYGGVIVSNCDPVSYTHLDVYKRQELGCAYIKGLQGPDPEHPKAAACAKHFAVHSGPEALRHQFNAQVSKLSLILI